MKQQAIVPCGAALCNVQAADSILHTLTACPNPSVYKWPCPRAYLGEAGRPNIGLNRHHRPDLSVDQEAGPGAGGFQQPMPKRPTRQAIKHCQLRDLHDEQVSWLRAAGHQSGIRYAYVIYYSEYFFQRTSSNIHYVAF